MLMIKTLITWRKKIQTDITIYAGQNSENTEDQEVQHNDELVDSNGEDEAEELCDREAANTNTQYDVVPAELKFDDVGYLEFDEITKLP